MKTRSGRTEQSAPKITNAQIEQLQSILAAGPGDPLFAPGSASTCPDCGRRMVTTNDLEETIAAPGLVIIVTRLPGARCESCGAKQLDGSGVGIVESSLPKGIVADYETSVTHSSGKTLGTYFKMDLARVLDLTGSERLFWKVVDKNRAVVSVQRGYGRGRSHSDLYPRARNPRVEPPPSTRARSRKQRIAA
ncbi:MAG: hypothetical protein L3J97_01070 [Thermoplasmata archaeon]|nr:hypothetical protein [Thermoplasmata archaeon]